MKCPVCKIHRPTLHPTYGILPCKSCTTKARNFSHPENTIEFTSQSIKDQRPAYITDTLPWHRSGTLDRGAIDRYGIDAVKKRGYTDREIASATYVWNGTRDITYYKKS